jgi:hypothetical protein
MNGAAAIARANVSPSAREKQGVPLLFGARVARAAATLAQEGSP